VIDADATLTIGQIARRAGVATSAIRYYESVGVLPEPVRVGGQRRYAPDVVRRLAIVDVAQRAGFTLAEIADLLNTDDAPAYQRMRELAERKLPEIDALIRRAEAVRRWLEMTRACDCDTIDMCSLFDDRLLRPDDRPARRMGAVAV
jgi:MerR family transcriptional regulator, redox-sensitive transcriptional activator SoxR